MGYILREQKNMAFYICLLINEMMRKKDAVRKFCHGYRVCGSRVKSKYDIGILLEKARLEILIIQ